MITLEFTDAATMEQQAVQAGLTLPIEQTAVWAKYQNTIDGRTPWGVYVVKQDGAQSRSSHSSITKPMATTI